MAIDLRMLRYFVEVARSGSVSRAAAMLHIAQPALSRQIRKLEDEIGGVLFRRSSSGVEPTPLGGLLWERANTLLADFSALREELDHVLKQPTGEVQLAIIPGAGRMLAPRLYARVLAALPGVGLQVTEANTADINHGMRDGNFDVAIYPDPGDSAAVNRVLLIEERLYLVSAAPNGTGTVATEPISLAELSQIPLLLPTSLSLLTKQLLEVARSHGIRFNIVSSTVTSMQIAKLIVRDSGHTILGYSSIQQEARNGELLLRPIGDPPLTRRFVWAVRRGKPGNEAILAPLLAIVREEMARLVEEGVWEGRLLWPA